MSPVWEITNQNTDTGLVVWRVSASDGAVPPKRRMISGGLVIGLPFAGDLVGRVKTLLGERNVADLEKQVIDAVQG